MNSRDLSLSGVAKEIRTRRGNVKRLIETGELEGYVIDPSAKRPSYRVTRKALDDFKARRSARKTPAAARKKAPKPQNMVQYF